MDRAPAGGGTYLAQRGSLSTGDGEFDWPFGVSVDGAGNVDVADFSNHRIQKFGRRLYIPLIMSG